MANNAEHIKVLRAMQSHIEMQAPLCDQWFALTTAIRALKTQGRSPWRKVTNRHPGKKWAGERVLTEWSCGRRTVEDIPPEGSGLWKWWLQYITHWQPWPEHPEKGKEGLSHD